MDILVMQWVNALTTFHEVTRADAFYLDSTIEKARVDLDAARKAVIDSPKRPNFPFSLPSHAAFRKSVRSLALAWDAAHKEAV